MTLFAEAAQYLVAAIDAGALRHAAEQMPDSFSLEQVEHFRAEERAAWAKVPTMVDFGFTPSVSKDDPS